MLGPSPLRSVASVAAVCGFACSSSTLPGSGATGGTGGSPACAKTTPSPPAVTGDMVRDTAQANEFAFVDTTVGGYLRGDSPAYVGSASASDDSGTLGGPLSFSTGSAIAAVVISADWALFTVASAADHDRFDPRSADHLPGRHHRDGDLAGRHLPGRLQRQRHLHLVYAGLLHAPIEPHVERRRRELPWLLSRRRRRISGVRRHEARSTTRPCRPAP